MSSAGTGGVRRTGADAVWARAFPREHLEKNGSDRVLVTLGRRGLSFALLRAHVRESADDARGRRRGEVAEVGHPEVPEACPADLVEEDVCRLHVAVENAEAMGLIESGEERARDLDRARGG